MSRGTYEGNDDEPIIPPQVLEQASPCVHAKANTDGRQRAEDPGESVEP